MYSIIPKSMLIIWCSHYLNHYAKYQAISTPIVDRMDSSRKSIDLYCENVKFSHISTYPFVEIYFRRLCEKSIIVLFDITSKKWSTTFDPHRWIFISIKASELNSKPLRTIKPTINLKRLLGTSFSQRKNICSFLERCCGLRRSVFGELNTKQWMWLFYWHELQAILLTFIL